MGLLGNGEADQRERRALQMRAVNKVESSRKTRILLIRGGGENLRTGLIEQGHGRMFREGKHKEKREAGKNCTTCNPSGKGPVPLRTGAVVPKIGANVMEEGTIMTTERREGGSPTNDLERTRSRILTKSELLNRSQRSSFHHEETELEGTCRRRSPQ